jgi:DNA-binding MarR family transcriptional regulator
MSRGNLMEKRSREALVAAVIAASRENSTTAVFFHTAIAEQVGLGATDEKTLAILSREGPLTAGEIAQHTGLTTASVTSLIDRLESKGFVRRVRDIKDRRRVIVEPDPARLAEFGRLFGSVQSSFQELLESYSDEQLSTIADFLTRAAQHSHTIIASLKQADRAGQASKLAGEEN